jgi:hypothetical protein
MYRNPRSIVAILITSIWVNASEFVRNELC